MHTERLHGARITQRSRSGTLRADLGLDRCPFSCLGILALKIG